MIIKTKTEIYFTIDNVVIDNNTGIATINLIAKNPYLFSASLSKAEFQMNLEWYSMTLCEEQDVDLMDIKLSGKPKTIPIKWDVAKDLQILSAYSNVYIYIVLNDRPDLEGELSTPYYFYIDSLDFRVSDLKLLITPYSNDPYFKIKFINRATLQPSYMHFIIEIATDENFVNIIKDYYSSKDITGWSVNGEPMSEYGVNGEDENEIDFEDLELSSLIESNYYLRIIPIVYQFYDTINQPYEGQLIVSNPVTIGGTITVVKEE